MRKLIAKKGNKNCVYKNSETGKLDSVYAVYEGYIYYTDGKKVYDERMKMVHPVIFDDFDEMFIDYRAPEPPHGKRKLCKARSKNRHATR